MATLAAILDVTAAAERAERSASAPAMRRPEWIIGAFLVYAPVLAFLLGRPPALGMQLAALNAAAIFAYAALIYFDSLKTNKVLRALRDWVPLGMVLVAYREMGRFALPHTGYPLESRWVVWDRLFLNGGGRAAIEFLGPVWPSILEIAYALVYTLAPLALVALYLYGRRSRIDRFLAVFVLGVLLCYVQFPFWPSEPPRTVFSGQDLPTYITIFRRFNLWMLGNYGIHTSVFPSAHVAGALSVAYGMRQAIPERKWLYRAVFVIAALIALATVYGRYHYLADATYGAVVATFAAALVNRLYQSGQSGSRASASETAAWSTSFPSAPRRSVPPAAVVATTHGIRASEQQRFHPVSVDFRFGRRPLEHGEAAVLRGDERDGIVLIVDELRGR
jgi:membrane-associated phospholipid phosphatase